MTARSGTLIRAFGITAAAVLVMLILASRAFAQADIVSAGPLTDITVGDDLSCQVQAGGFDQFFGDAPGSCGTAVVVGGQSYGTAVEGDGAFTPVSPATLAGAGTAQDPYTVTTTVEALDANASPLVALTEVDSYVVGNAYYRTGMTVTNVSGTPITNLILYHAGDCYLGGDDSGFGFLDAASGTVACAQNADDSPGGPFMAFEPITADDHYVEAQYGYVFAAIMDDTDFPDVVDTNGDPDNPGNPEDNGEGINWDTGMLAPGVPQTYSMCTTFSSGAVGTPCSSSASSPPPPPPTPTTAPAVLATSPASVSTSGAGVTGSVDPGGLATTAYFEYGLDPKYTGGGPVTYPQSTPAQSVGSDFSTHAVSASLTGLVPNALYHIRLVATNTAGTTLGQDVTFSTQAAPAPAPPTLGHNFNIQPVTGTVLVLINGKFVPLTQVTQIPNNTEINALHGTINLITAAAGSGGARDAAAKGKKHKGKTPTQSGSFGGAVFRLNQTTAGKNKGLTTLTLVENAFNGAPSYSVCTTHKAPDATVAKASTKTLQLLHASAHGKFTTKGRYGAATVLGTKWTTADRCDGTLIHDITDSVMVTDFVRHKTIVLHAGQSYLAKART